MSYCHERGIPHSEFLNWKAEDRAKTLAFSLEASLRCSLCGTAPWEWEQNKFAYEPDEKRCHGCYLKQSFATSLDNKLPGTTVELLPVTPQRRAQQLMNFEKRAAMMRED